MWRMYMHNMQGAGNRAAQRPFAGRHEPMIVEKRGAIQGMDAEIVIARENESGGTRSEP